MDAVDWSRRSSTSRERGGEFWCECACVRLAACAAGFVCGHLKMANEVDEMDGREKRIAAKRYSDSELVQRYACMYTETWERERFQ